jgi:transposase-like protein
MAETKRMTAEQVVGYLLEGEGLDVLRESLAWVVQQLMEAEVSELIGAQRGERTPEEDVPPAVEFRRRPFADDYAVTTIAASSVGDGMVLCSRSLSIATTSLARSW